VGSPLEAARLVQAGSLLGLRSGILLAVPVPPSEAGPGERIEAAVRAALEEAEQGGVRGREVTPFVLAR
jgi:pseudouridine-5'-phosphate glycosidase